MSKPEEREGPTQTVTVQHGETRPRVLAFWDSSRAERPLPDHGALTIGRGLDCDVRIEHPSVSRLHARIHVGPVWTVAIEDAGSSNGVTVQGRRLVAGERVRLIADQPVRIGSAVLVVHGIPADATSPAARVGDGRSLVDLVSESHVNVLLVGETGVGKEVTARAIHERSPRAHGPFVAVNGASLTEGLFESELFGHERGAFTGAVERKLGLFEAAHAGTLFLDEVGELTLTSQAKLLRVIENREVLRVGAVRPTKVDVRFVAATNRDLRAMCADGSFREDLYYRLNGMTIAIPPLRDRRQEIRPLALELARANAGARSASFTEEALLLLEQHAWPGNVRQLRNVVDRAVLLARGGVIGPEHVLFDEERSVPSSRGAPLRVPDVAAVVPRHEQRPASLLPEELAAVERRRIVDALEQCAGNQSRAAQVLGVTRRVLQRRIEQYGLPRPRKP